MHTRICALISFLCIGFAFASKNANVVQQREEQCLWYYQRGEPFDLTTLSGEMNAVYFWPMPSRLRDSCEVITFEELTTNALQNLTSECKTKNISSVETAVKATYKNTAGKRVSVVYLGNGVTKTMFRSCDRDLSNYVFVQVEKNFVLGINCSAGGRGVLLARFKPSKKEVKDIVDTIDIMNGRTGGPDCP